MEGYSVGERSGEVGLLCALQGDHCVAMVVRHSCRLEAAANLMELLLW